MTTFTLERTDDDIAILRFSRPPVNSLSIATLGELHATLDQLRANLPRAVVVIGDGPFSGGADIDEFVSPEAARDVAGAFREALDALAAFPRITVAAVAKYALGGGFELALACDFRVFADDAAVGLPEVQLGIMPGGGGTQRLAALVGSHHALEIAATGRRIKATEALALGLCDAVEDADELETEALAFARRFATGATAAQGLIKRAVQAAGGSDGYAVETEAFVEVFSTDDATHGIDSFRTNGPGKATFNGR